MTATPEQVIDAYCHCWRQMDAAARAAVLARVCTEEVTYADPTVELSGLADFAAHIERTMAARSAGVTIVRTSVVDRHHDAARFGWNLVQPDGATGAPSIDVVTFAPDGRLATILGFFGPLGAL